MTTRDIVSKLTNELDGGIETEVQAVYLLAGIRKIIERDKVGGQYPNLKFHCNWVLHSRLDQAPAQAILAKFDAAHALLKGKVKLQDLPPALSSEIDRISKMQSFHKELSGFLAAYGPTADEEPPRRVGPLPPPVRQGRRGHPPRGLFVRRCEAHISRDGALLRGAGPDLGGPPMGKKCYSR
jgi:hypothetical protein